MANTALWSGALWFLVLELLVTPGLLGQGAAAEAGPELRFYEKVSTCPTAKTKAAGGPGGAPFEDVRGEGGVLVGLQVWTGDYAGHLVIRGVRPIFQTAAGRVRGELHGLKGAKSTVVEAREGYAVAQMNLQTGDRVDGLELQYWRIATSSLSLDAAGAYKSEWVGGKGGGKTRSPLSGNGNPVIGIHGASGVELDRLGLVVGRTR